MDSNDCREFSKRCIELANHASDSGQSTLFELAAGWLRLAAELDSDKAFRDRMKGVEIFPASAVRATTSSLTPSSLILPPKN